MKFIEDSCSCLTKSVQHRYCIKVRNFAQSCHNMQLQKQLYIAIMPGVTTEYEWKSFVDIPLMFLLYYWQLWAQHCTQPSTFCLGETVFSLHRRTLSHPWRATWLSLFLCLVICLPDAHWQTRPINICAIPWWTNGLIQHHQIILPMVQDIIVSAEALPAASAPQLGIEPWFISNYFSIWNHGRIVLLVPQSLDPHFQSSVSVACFQ